MSSSHLFFQELKQISRLALPILIAQLSFTAMGFVDTVMAGHYSEIDLAAIAMGTSLTIPLVLFGQAILFSVTAKAAPHWGAGNYRKAGRNFQEGVMLALISSVPLVFLLLFLSTKLEQFGIPKDIAAIARDYQFYIALSLPITGLFQASRSFIESTGQTRPIMIINFIGLLANIPLNYIFIYGYLNIPAMGSVGCGLATLLSFVLMLILSWLFITYNARCQKAFSHKTSLKMSFRELNDLLKGALNLAKLGLPIALTMMAEVSLFTVIALLIAPLGTLVIASHQIALSISSQIFMLPYSQATAMTIRIGYLLGQGNSAKVRHSIKVGLMLGVFVSIFTASFVYLASQWLAGLYTNSGEIIIIAAGLLSLAAVYQIPDAIQVISNGILRAFHCVRKPLAVSLFSYWIIALPAGYFLAFSPQLNSPLGAKGFWLALVIGLTLNAIGLGLLLKQQLKLHATEASRENTSS